MELWKASMTPIIESSLGPNGFEAIVIYDSSPSTLNSSTIDTIGTACLKGKTPLQTIQEADYTPILLPPRFKASHIDYTPDGTISLIRFIRSDQKLDVFGEHFELPKNLVYTYVRAKIITALHQIQVYLGDDVVAYFPYQLPAWITPDP